MHCFGVVSFTEIHFVSWACHLQSRIFFCHSCQMKNTIKSRCHILFISCLCLSGLIFKVSMEFLLVIINPTTSCRKVSNKIVSIVYTWFYFTLPLAAFCLFSLFLSLFISWSLFMVPFSLLNIITKRNLERKCFISFYNL